MPVSMKHYEVGFRGPASSDQYNQSMTYVHKDLLTAHRLLERENARLSNYLNAMNYHNQVLDSQLDNLTSSIQQIKSAWESNDGSSIIHADFHTDASIETGYISAIPAFVDIVHGQIRLPTSQSWSKIPVFKNQDGFYDATDDVSLYLDEADGEPNIGDGTYQDRSTGAYKALDRNPATFWIKEWVNPAQPNFATVRIILPQAINPSINSILVHPFPNWGLTMKGVDYLSLAGSWVQVPNSAETNATYKMFHFYSRDYDNQIRIRLTPSSSLLDNLDGENRAIVGLQNVDVGYTEYQDQAEIVTMHQASTYIDSLSGFQASYELNTAEAGDYSAYDKNYIWWEVFPFIPSQGSSEGKIYDSRTNVYPLTSSSSAIPVTTSTTRFYVRTNFVRVSNTTPVLKSLTLNYRT